jgi:hypothetical protein
LHEFLSELDSQWVHKRLKSIEDVRRFFMVTAPEKTTKMNDERIKIYLLKSEPGFEEIRKSRLATFHLNSVYP